MGVQPDGGDRALKADGPLVSIVVPVYNGERFLRQSLASIVAQTYPHVEVLVMDDASEDRTPQIAQEFGGSLTYVRQSRNRGQFRNVQDGIARSRGEFVCVYHADDVYRETIVEKSVAFLERHPAAGAVFTMDSFMDEDGTVYGKLELPPEVRGGGLLEFGTVLNALLAHGNRFLRTPGTMVRSRVYRDVGPYRGDQFGTAADLDMWLRISRRYPIGIIEEHLFDYRHTDESEGHRALHLRTEPDLTFQVVKAHLDDDARALLDPAAWREHEAHVQEDRIMIAVNRYIRGEATEMRRELRRVSLPALLRGRNVDRVRLSALYFLLRGITLFPQVPAVARAFQGRWHVRRWRNRG